MIALASLFLVVISSLLVTRVATVMLTLTGLSRESARFQARSAFSGAGFTTHESESVMNHPVRRRIIMNLILLGGAGIVSGLVSLLLSFSDIGSSTDAAGRILVLAGGLLILWRLAASQWADYWMSRTIERMLRRFTDLEIRDYAGLLRLSNNWVVGEITVEPGDWFCDMTLQELRLPEEGVLVLGIERTDGRWVGAPKGAAILHEGDLVVLYGSRATLDRLDRRARDAEGELDWVASQIEFTEQCLQQQEGEHDMEEQLEEGEHDMEAGDDRT